MRPWPVLPLLLCLGACAGAPAADTAASPLARAALDEWEAWGRVTVDGWPAMRPAQIVTTPERFARLIGYWNAVPDGDAVVARLTGLYLALRAPRTEPEQADGGDGPAPPPEDIGIYARPAWSAAFISAVARRAGIAEGDLPSSSRHASYIDAMLERALSDPDGARFRPYAPGERAPVPGDLLCADRSTVPLAHWSMRLEEAGQPRPMHCDVVVRTRPGAIEAVGGNVEDLVVLRRLPADRDGRVLPAPPGEAVFILVLAAQRRPG